MSKDTESPSPAETPPEEAPGGPHAAAQSPEARILDLLSALYPVAASSAFAEASGAANQRYRCSSPLTSNTVKLIVTNSKPIFRIPTTLL